MFMLTSTHKAILGVCHALAEKWKELAINRADQILVLNKTISLLEKQLAIYKPTSKLSDPDKYTKQPKKDDSRYITDSSPLMDTTSTVLLGTTMLCDSVETKAPETSVVQSFMSSYSDSCSSHDNSYSSSSNSD